MFEINWSSVMPTFPTATPIHKTFFSWNLMVDLTSLILELRSSLCETGVGNLPAAECKPHNHKGGAVPDDCTIREENTYPLTNQDPKDGEFA